MITAQMRAAGWRERPSDDVRYAWESKGGRWQVLCEHGACPPHPGFARKDAACPWRPVSPTTWDYAPEGWGDVLPDVERLSSYDSIDLESILALSRLILRFGRVERITLDADGRPESDTTHTMMLALLAGALAPLEAVPLDQSAVVGLALIHDLAEAHAGDTPTLHALSPEDVEDKALREAAAVERIRAELSAFPWILSLIDRYERQECDESRFVRYVDKALPKLTHRDNGCLVSRRDGMTLEQFKARHRSQEAELGIQYPHLRMVRQLLAMACRDSEEQWEKSAPIASTPEPPPKCEGQEVTPPLLAWLEASGYHDAATLVRQRDAFGRSKYGQGLMTDDGRDTLEDARQEVGDLLQYAFKARLQGLSLGELRPLLEVALRLTLPDDRMPTVEQVESAGGSQWHWLTREGNNNGNPMPVEVYTHHDEPLCVCVPPSYSEPIAEVHGVWGGPCLGMPGGTR